MHIFIRSDSEGNPIGWRGFTQVLSSSIILPASLSNTTIQNGEQPNGFLESMPGFATMEGKILPAEKPWTPTVLSSLQSNQAVFSSNHSQPFPALSIPIGVNGKTAGILEILDENNRKNWSQDDRLLAQEVASQLGLALENAQLFASAQQELADRKAAENETLQRNRDLATLNQIGQQINQLSSPSKIYDLVSTAIGKVMDNKNLFIAEFDEDSQHINFPIYIIDGQPQIVPGRQFTKGFIEHIIKQRSPLLIRDHVGKFLTSCGLEPLTHMLYRVSQKSILQRHRLICSQRWLRRQQLHSRTPICSSKCKEHLSPSRCVNDTKRGLRMRLLR
jgi:GAF domain-containing protein